MAGAVPAYDYQQLAQVLIANIAAAGVAPAAGAANADPTAHYSGVQIVLYDTRDDMERIPPDAVDTNAFPNMVTQKQKEWNDAHPGWQADGAVMFAWGVLNTFQIRSFLVG